MCKDLVQITDEFIGNTLIDVRTLILDYPNEPGPSIREGVLLDFPDSSIVIQALTDTSELLVRTGKLIPDCSAEDRAYYTECSLSGEMPFSKFIGQSLQNWWSLKNEKGYNDGFMVSFSRHQPQFS